MRHSKPLDQALAQNPKERQAGIYRALVLSGLEKPEGAAEQLRRTSAYYPDDPEILYQLGEAYNEGIRQSGDLLYRSSRDSPLYQWAMALSAEAKNDAHGAIRHYLAALTLDPVIPKSMFALWCCCERSECRKCRVTLSSVSRA